MTISPKQSTIEIKIPMQNDAEFKIEAIAFVPISEPISLHILRHKYQTQSLTIRGTKPIAITIIPKAPIVFFIKLTQLCAVESASESAVPIAGTKLPTTNLAALELIVSAPTETIVCSDKKLTKTVVKRENVQTTAFFIVWETEFNDISGTMFPRTEIAK